MMKALTILLGFSASVQAQQPDTGPLLAPPPPQPPLSEERRGLPEYPARALREGRDGTTYVRLAAEADGTIRDCVIMRSSGHDDLDASACNVAIRRARIPMEHEASKPRYYMVPVRWALANPSEAPPEVPPH